MEQDSTANASPIVGCNRNAIDEPSERTTSENVVVQAQPDHLEKETSNIIGTKRNCSDEQESVATVGQKKKWAKKTIDSTELMNAATSSTPMPRQSNRVPKPKKTPIDFSTNTTGPAPTLTDESTPDQGQDSNEQAEPKKHGRPQGCHETYVYVPIQPAKQSQ